MSRKLIAMAILMVFAVALMLGTLFAQDSAKVDTTKSGEKKFDYVGDTKCKICHKIEHTSWATTKHAKAWEVLKPEEQKKEECIGCHSTGKAADGTLLVGVQCESCHGPGSEYKALKIMKDKKASLAAGLIMPTKEVCVSCHNEKSPTFKGFEFEKAVKDVKGVHEKTPPKPAEKG